jgi:hypothetical protein
MKEQVRMISFETLLHRLDQWRSIPDYQLERRVDIFLSYYLKDVLSDHLQLVMDEFVIPEFPVHQRLTKNPPPRGELSDKIDFVIPSVDRLTVVFVELKTAMDSRRPCQCELMNKCADMQFIDVLRGVIDIARESKAYSKYATLLSHLESMGYIEIPEAFWQLDFHGSPYGYKRIIRQIKIIPIEAKILPVFIQPRHDSNESNIVVIDFKELAKTIAKQNDPLSKALAQTLPKWSTDPGLVRL